MCVAVAGVYGIDRDDGEHMMDLIRDWLVGVTVAAMIAALADSLTPDGAAKKIGKLASGMLLVIAILRPMIGLDYDAMSGILTDYRFEAEGYSAALETENIRLMKTIIEEQTAAYIQDKAAELGVTCTAQVTCCVEDDNTPYPASVIVYGDLTQEQIKTMSRAIEGELAIAAEDQQYERMTEP